MADVAVVPAKIYFVELADLLQFFAKNLFTKPADVAYDFTKFVSRRMTSGRWLRKNFISRKLLTWHMTSQRPYFTFHADVASDFVKNSFSEWWWRGNGFGETIIRGSCWRGKGFTKTIFHEAYWRGNFFYFYFEKSKKYYLFPFWLCFRQRLRWILNFNSHLTTHLRHVMGHYLFLEPGQWLPCSE